jgi:hypothetical protein
VALQYSRTYPLQNEKSPEPFHHMNLVQ